MMKIEISTQLYLTWRVKSIAFFDGDVANMLAAAAHKLFVAQLQSIRIILEQLILDYSYQKINIDRN